MFYVVGWQFGGGGGKAGAREWCVGEGGGGVWWGEGGGGEWGVGGGGGGSGGARWEGMLVGCEGVLA